MKFLIAETLTDSLVKLTGQEQKAVKTTAFDLQTNPANPGMQFHKLDRAKDQNFWSVRVNLDIRLIVHKTKESLLLCYAGHHRDAYQWAERRKLEIHPKTGAAQLVEIQEKTKEIFIPIYVKKAQPKVTKPSLFSDVSKDDILSWGVPADWVDDVLQANEDSVLDLAEHLPSEAAEAILDVATGGRPKVSTAFHKYINPFDHPESQRRFRVMKNVEELECALNYPWEKWTIFLHPVQRELVERDYNGPARVSGSAGTGKTIVALHRAVFLARSNPNERVMLTTFSDALANVLKIKLRRLISNKPRIAERLEIQSINHFGKRLYKIYFNNLNIVSSDTLKLIIQEASRKIGNVKFSQPFLLSEWALVVDAWQLDSWEAYRDVIRLGRKIRLPENQRVQLWSIFEHVRSILRKQGLITYSAMFSRLASKLYERNIKPFDYVVVDESQDISISQLRFMSALGSGKPNGLFFAGDLGQRIFQQPFSWKSLGVDIRGRSRTLRINYRTSHQIRMQADLLLGPELSDVDGNIEKRKGTISVFNGPKPTIKVFDALEKENESVSEWIKNRIEEGVKPYEIGVFVRSQAQIIRASKSVERSGYPFNVLDQNYISASDHISISTMHLAKGLEYRAVIVMACDDEVIPSQERIETVSDDSDLEEVYNTERHLLYVACTRARDYLLLTSVDPSSEFLDDLRV